MKRIIKIAMLSLWICAGGSDDAQIMEKVQALQKRIDQIIGEHGPAPDRAQLRQDAERLQKIDFEKHNLLNQLSNPAKQRIADEFVVELNSKLRDGDGFAIATFLFVDNAPHMHDFENFISFDQGLADLLTQASFLDNFRLLFRSFTECGYYSNEHIFSIFNLIYFIMTGIDIRAMNTEEIGNAMMRSMKAGPNIGFIMEMYRFSVTAERCVLHYFELTCIMSYGTS
jgi:hypothetical protein